MSASRGYAALAIACLTLILGCSPRDMSGEEPSSVNPTESASPSDYVLPASVGSYTTVWESEPRTDLQSAPMAIVRATVEAKAVAEMVGRYDTYPGYGRFLDEATQTSQGRERIDVEDTPIYENPIALNGTRHYRMFDITQTDTSIAASICDITFGIYQQEPAPLRGIWDPADLQKVTDPNRLDNGGHIPAYSHLWRVEVQRSHAPEESPTPPDATPTTTTDLGSTARERYPNQDLFEGWALERYSITPTAERSCDSWALAAYPVGIIGNKGIAYPTNPVDPAYLPTLPPYPGWTHVPAV